MHGNPVKRGLVISPEDPDVDPEFPVPTASISCVWERAYVKAVYGQAIQISWIECYDDCGRIVETYVDTKKVSWFKSRTTEIEPKGTGPFPAMGATDEIYELQCIQLGPPR